MTKNGWKKVFDDTYLHNLLYHTQISSKGQQVVLDYPMVSPRVPTILMTPHLWIKMAQNGWKQVFDDIYIHNLLFYAQICSIG